MTDVIVKNVSVPAEPKVTAAQIEAECPDRLREIGKEITERFKKAQNGYQKAADHMDAIKALMDEAERLCDGGGFKKFRELFCPRLRKSQAYVRHAIATGKKKIEHHKAEQRDRQRKSRAKRKSHSENSVTVTETLSSERLEVLPRETSSIGATRPDRSLLAFSVQVVELAQKVKNRAPAHFVGTIASAETLSELSKFLSQLADLKRSAAADPPPAASSENAVATASPLTCSREQVHQYDHTSK
jgi:hypothetical protein